MSRVTARAIGAVAIVLALTLPGLKGHAVAADPETPTDTPRFERLEHLALRLKEAEKAVEKTVLWEEFRLQFYGYLEGSYTQNFNNPSNRINQLRIFDVNSNEVRPNLAQFVLAREAKSDGGTLDRLGFKVKFNAGRDSDFIGGFNLSTWADFQEFFVQYVAPVGNGLRLQVGQSNGLVGYEVVESPYNVNYSRSWLFGLGQPFTTRGIRATYDFGDRVTWAVGAINHINSNMGDNHTKPWIESALTFAYSEKVKLTLYGLVGSGMNNIPVSWGSLLLGGGFFSVQATERASFVLESYYANQVDSSPTRPGQNARWDGVAGYVIYDVTKQWGIRIRGEIFEDPSGFASCGGTTAYQPRANVCFGATSTSPAPPVGQTLWEVTTTLQYKPFQSFTTRLEYRYDKSDKNVFQVGERAASYQPTLSLEVIYQF